MFNPFDLRGPEFLVFYSVTGIVVNLLLRFLLPGEQLGNSASLQVCTHPYKLAALRGGASEVLRIVLFSLIDRGLLKASGDSVVAEPDARKMANRTVEQRVVDYFQEPWNVECLFYDAQAVDAAEEYCRELAAEGLMADSKIIDRRRKMSIAGLLLLIGMSAIKIVIALSRGRHNIFFLIVLTVIFAYWVISTCSRKRTGAGDEVLRRARLKFEPLKERVESIRPGGMTNDAVFLAAVFGLAALPSACFPYVPTLFPQTVAASNSGGDSGGCSCGGCSGGCGGGGCGGCGGCGG